MDKGNRVYIKVLSILLPIIYIAYVMGATLFVHYHVVNGVKIVHSHPFKDAKHNSATEIQLINVLNNYTSTQPTILQCPSEYIPILLLVVSTRIVLDKYTYKCVGTLTLRGPPSV